MEPFFQVGVVVPDLEQAMEELGQGLGIGWHRATDVQIGPWDVRVVFSIDGPPHIELIQGPPGSPWDAAGGSRLDHLGYWAADNEQGKAELERRGLPIEVDGADYDRPSFVYHRAPSTGIRVELIDGTAAADLRSRLAGVT